MQTRCPFADCLQVFDFPEKNEFNRIACEKCERIFSARSLARHLEIDKQVEKHRQNSSLAEQFFQNQEQENAGGTPVLPGSDPMLAKNTGGTPDSLPMLAILEEIRSLWNVGSIFRSSDGAGFSHLFLVGITGCPPRKEIAKTSLGAEDHVAWNYSGNALPVIQILKSQGYQIIGLEKTETSTPLSTALAEGRLKKPLCLIVGSETKGIYAETLAECDLVLDLPMKGFKESLNVAVAFGIAAYAISETLAT